MCSTERPRQKGKLNHFTPAEGPAKKALNLDRYATYFFTTITNKLSNGASRLYLKEFQIGVVEWRVIAMLCIEPRIPAMRITQVIAIDKGSVSRAVTSLHKQGYLREIVDEVDERRKNLELTAAGYKLHNRIINLALERERRLLSGFTDKEVDVLLEFLGRILGNMASVNSVENEARPARASLAIKGFGRNAGKNAR
jgi:DNA-binding MarR family transcriptional regulator